VLACKHKCNHGGFMVRTQVQLTERQVKLLKQLAASKNTSVAEIIRQAIDNFLKMQTTVDLEERKQRAIKAAGHFRSGISDLSEAHDKYLNEIFSK